MGESLLKSQLSTKEYIKQKFFAHFSLPIFWLFFKFILMWRIICSQRLLLSSASPNCSTFFIASHSLWIYFNALFVISPSLSYERSNVTTFGYKSLTYFQSEELDGRTVSGTSKTLLVFISAKARIVFDFLPFISNHLFFHITP